MNRTATTAVLVLTLGLACSAALAQTRAHYNAGTLYYFDYATTERVASFAPVVFADDFLGNDVSTAVSSTGDGVWTSVQTNLNTAIDTLDGQGSGVVQITMDSDSNAENGTLYWGDVRGIDVSKTAIFECRAKFYALPTTASTSIVLGLAGDHNTTHDSITEHAWFRLDGDTTSVDCETDDTTNDNDDKASGITAATTEWHYYRIDFTTQSDVKFYVDGTAVATSTTFDMSNFTAAEALMQPYFSCTKSDGAGVGTLYVDYVRVWSERE